MKRSLLLLTVLLGYLSCIQTGEPSALIGTWQLEAYHDLENGSIAYNPDKQPGTIEITFKDDGKKGSFRGHTLSNNIQGEYTLDGQGGMHIYNFGGAKVKENKKWSATFWDAIRQTTNYEITTNHLVIYYNKGRAKMTFIHQ